MITTQLNKVYFAIIGKGQISSHIPFLFSKLCLSKIQSNSDNLDSFLNYPENLDLYKSYFRFFDRLTNFKSLDLSSTKCVFLAVKDSQILQTYLSLKEYFPKSTTFYHLSGALYIPQLIGIHPLMTFTKSEKDIKYSQVPLFTDHKIFYDEFHTVIENLKFISPELKTKYHAMAVMLGNFTQYYLQSLKDQFPQELDFNDYKMLVEYSVQNIFKNDSKLNLTGPLVRGDTATLQKHKNEFKNNNVEILDIYLKMEELFLKGPEIS